MTQKSPMPERDLYDPNRDLWYRGHAERTTTYYHRERQQWVTVALPSSDAPPDEQRGIYGKYRVDRIGGTPGKHDDCWYYVLDFEHDKFARPALAAYVEACRSEFPDLAADLDRVLGNEVADARA